MITMLWKELRENLKWGVLALLGLVMAEFYAMNQQQFFGFYVQESAPLVKTSFLMITTFGCAAVGLVLGLVQILPEQRRDQWAALIHRPVPRGTLFRGKALAGLILYLFATVPPFLACVWYVATPNHFAAPFSPRMVYPGVVDICAGAMYYFAALFVGLRRGPWYGTRAFGFLAAVAGSFMLTAWNLKFHVALEAPIFLSLALFTAAWGAMLSNGTLRDQPWLARLAVLAVVFYGVTTLGSIADMIWDAFQQQSYYFYERYIIDIDGEPLLSSTEPDGHNSLRDLTGKIVDDPKFKKTGLNQFTQVYLTELSSYVGQSHGLATSTNFNNGYRRSETYAQPLYFSRVEGESWFYLPVEQVFSGFNSYNHRLIGTIGQDGFQANSSRATSFSKRVAVADNGQIVNVFRVGTNVYAFSPQERSAKVIFSSPIQPISGVGNINNYNPQPGQKDLAAIVVADRTEVITTQGEPVATLHYDRDMDRWGVLQIGFASAAQKFVLQYNPSPWIDWNERRKMPSYVEQFDLSGHLLKSYTLPPIEQQDFGRTWHQYVNESLQTPVFNFGNLVYEVIGGLAGSKRLQSQSYGHFHDGWFYTKQIIIRITTVSLFFAVVALVWARRAQFSWRRAWAWTAFVFAFNLAGLIVFRLVADWPVLIKCPQCGRPRRVDQPNCVHCGAAWPTPVHDGTEIMDEVPNPAAAMV